MYFHIDIASVKHARLQFKLPIRVSMDNRRAVRDMSQRRRNDGFSPLEINTIMEGLSLVVRLIMLFAFIPPSLVKNVVLALASGLFIVVKQSTQFIRNRLDPIDATNKNRLVDSFSEEECWDYFRFQKNQMKELVALLELPEHFVCEHGHTFPAEHAVCVYLYLHTYPSKLQRIQNLFGREISQLFRISNRVKSFLLTKHSHKVFKNLDWYSDRFDMYADAVNRAVQNSPYVILYLYIYICTGIYSVCTAMGSAEVSSILFESPFISSYIYFFSHDRVFSYFVWISRL